MTTTRRTFFGGAAALTAPLAASAALAADDGADVVARLAALEDANAIRELLRTYSRLLNAGAREQLAALFVESAHFALDASVRSAVPDTLDAGEIAVAADGTATARQPCVVETATSIDGDGTLVEMARLQGEGVIKRSERRVLASSFVKRAGVWQFVTAEFQA